jgi:hypothetical protein
MFMRYTHHGIGHPAALREITRDCTGADLVDNQNDNTNWMSNIHSCEDDSEKSRDDEDGGGDGDGDGDGDRGDELEGSEDGEEVGEGTNQYWQECDEDEELGVNYYPDELEMENSGENEDKEEDKEEDKDEEGYFVSF